jgi:superfamily I DNA and/or RNA helicase
MHSTIRKFPSKHFYDDLLTDSPTVLTREKMDEFNDFDILSGHFSRIVFFDLINSQES